MQDWRRTCDPRETQFLAQSRHALTAGRWKWVLSLSQRSFLEGHPGLGRVGLRMPQLSARSPLQSLARPPRCPKPCVAGVRWPSGASCPRPARPAPAGGRQATPGIWVARVGPGRRGHRGTALQARLPVWEARGRTMPHCSLAAPRSFLRTWGARPEVPAISGAG